MWVVITFLWALTLTVHKGYNLLPQELQPAVFYVARGIEGCALYLLVPYWLGRVISPLQMHMLILCAIYGATEEALTAICGTNYYLLAAGAQFTGSHLCSGPAALNWLTTTLLLVALLAMVAYERRRVGHG